MSISFPFSASPTISTTEWSVPNGGTTLTPRTEVGIFQVFVDCVANMVAGDQFRFRVYEKVNGGTQRVFGEWIPTGAQSQGLVIPALILGEGWDFTAIRLAGADRVFPISIRRVT